MTICKSVSGTVATDRLSVGKGTRGHCTTHTATIYNRQSTMRTACALESLPTATERAVKDSDA